MGMPISMRQSLNLDWISDGNIFILFYVSLKKTNFQLKKNYSNKTLGFYETISLHNWIFYEVMMNLDAEFLNSSNCIQFINNIFIGIFQYVINAIGKKFHIGRKHKL